MLTSEYTPVEQGHDFATSTGTLDREEITELSNISIENPIKRGSPTDNTMMHGVTQKAATSSSFSERVKETLGNFFPFTMGTGTGDEIDTKDEEEDNREINDYESQLSLNNSTHESEASKNIETGYWNQFCTVRTINKSIDGLQQSREFMTMINSDLQLRTTSVTVSGTTLVEREADHEETSRQRRTAGVSTSTKLPGTNKVTPPLVTLLLDNGASVEKALSTILDSKGEQS